MTFVSKIWGTDGNCVQNGHDIRDMHIIQLACFEIFAGEPALARGYGGETTANMALAKHASVDGIFDGITI
jgi:hypothetical protein